MQTTGLDASQTKIKIYFYNTVADLVGQREAQWTVAPGTRLGDLVVAIGEQHPSFRDYVAAPDAQAGHPLRLVHNGRLALDLDEQLVDGDEIRFFPIISGG